MTNRVNKGREPDYKYAREVYNWIIDFALKHHYLPRDQTIADGLYMSHSSVQNTLKNLAKMGLIEIHKEEGRHKSYSVVGLEYTLREGTKHL